MKFPAFLPLLATLPALAACATTANAPVEVLRYHLPQGVERGTVFVETAQAGLMSQPFEAAVARQLTANGYPLSDRAASLMIATVEVRRADRERPRSSGLSIGLGGGGFSGGRRGGGVGLGGGVSFPVGGHRSVDTATELSVLIKRRVDQTTVWEGHASTVRNARDRDGTDQATAEKLAAALFTGFPGESGRTISVK